MTSCSVFPASHCLCSLIIFFLSFAKQMHFSGPVDRYDGGFTISANNLTYETFPKNKEHATQYFAKESSANQGRSQFDFLSNFLVSDVQTSSEFTHSNRSSSIIIERTKRRANRRKKLRNRMRDDLSLWIDGDQVKSFGGYNTEIFVILNGRILPYILDPKFEDHLPDIPSEVSKVDFTWKAGHKKRYNYNFYVLSSSDKNILLNPQVTIKKKGRVPKKAKVFSVLIPCVENAYGVATFHFGLIIKTKRRKMLPGMPLNIRLKKKCEASESLIIPANPDLECDKKCPNGGFCDQDKKCRCPQGYMGQFCNLALCYPQCQNGGTCSAPGKCTCQPGYHGRFCEGGICKEKCLNGGKCVQKDTCFCRKGFFGNRCEFSKCVIPCVNGGKCRGVNKCKCKMGFAGDHCEIIDHGLSRRLVKKCKSKCRFGRCLSHGKCHCQSGYSGRWCQRKGRSRKKKLWI